MPLADVAAALVSRASSGRGSRFAFVKKKGTVEDLDGVILGFGTGLSKDAVFSLNIYKIHLPPTSVSR